MKVGVGGFGKTRGSHFKPFPHFSFPFLLSYSNGYTYVFKGTQYYRFNPWTQRVDPGYPRPLSSYWKGIPRDIEGALPWYNGGVYVFKDTQSWFFLHSSDSIGITSGYPKSVTTWWSDTPKISGYTVFRYVRVFQYLLRTHSSVGIIKHFKYTVSSLQNKPFYREAYGEKKGAV